MTHCDFGSWLGCLGVKLYITCSSKLQLSGRRAGLAEHQRPVDAISDLDHLDLDHLDLDHLSGRRCWSEELLHHAVALLRFPRLLRGHVLLLEAVTGATLSVSVNPAEKHQRHQRYHVLLACDRRRAFAPVAFLVRRVPRWSHIILAAYGLPVVDHVGDILYRGSDTATERVGEYSTPISTQSNICAQVMVEFVNRGRVILSGPCTLKP